jgi:anti-sigma factor ChrR (cupin superfamily)
MRAQSYVVVLAAAVVLAAPLARAADAAAAKGTLLPPDQLKWVAAQGVQGVQTAVTWGDPAKGPHGAFHKFTPGFSAALHTHSANTHAVVLAGTMAEAGEDGKETKLPAGSFFSQPNTWKHTTKCLAGAECVLYMEADAAWDLKPVEATKK